MKGIIDWLFEKPREFSSLTELLNYRMEGGYDHEAMVGSYDAVWNFPKQGIQEFLRKLPPNQRYHCLCAENWKLKEVAEKTGESDSCVPKSLLVRAIKAESENAKFKLTWDGNNIFFSVSDSG